MVGGFIYAELAARLPVVGGQYAYLRDAYGPMPAFLYGSAVFNEKIMQARLPKAVYKSLKKTIETGSSLDASTADVVALALTRLSLPIWNPVAVNCWMSLLLGADALN